MVVLVLDPSEQADVIRRRKESDCDRFDEVWDGVYVVSPNPNLEHQGVGTALATVLTIAIEWTGLGHVFQGVNVSDREDDWEHNYRIPDVAVYLQGNPARACVTHWFGGPDLAFEIVSPNDRCREKLPFYASIRTRADDRRSRPLGARVLPAPGRDPRPDRHVGPRATDPPGQCGLADELPPSSRGQNAPGSRWTMPTASSAGSSSAPTGARRPLPAFRSRVNRSLNLDGNRNPGRNLGPSSRHRRSYPQPRSRKPPSVRTGARAARALPRPQPPDRRRLPLPEEHRRIVDWLLWVAIRRLSAGGFIRIPGFSCARSADLKSEISNFRSGQSAQKI
ncbi:MAG: Uma2 family endonuclease [Planctomycetaceae bacterium]|nr:Uma2 family endonuclease [Planctomycetaceae bacterium]